MEKIKLPQSKPHQPYWGVLTPDPEGKLFHKPDNFIGLIQAQSQIVGTTPASRHLKNPPTGRVSGKHKSKHISKEIPL